MDEHHHLLSRLDSIERAVQAVASLMERMVSVEERNARLEEKLAIVQRDYQRQLDTLSSMFDKSINLLRDSDKEVALDVRRMIEELHEADKEVANEIRQMTSDLRSADKSVGQDVKELTKLLWRTSTLVGVGAALASIVVPILITLVIGKLI